MSAKRFLVTAGLIILGVVASAVAADLEPAARGRLDGGVVAAWDQGATSFRVIIHLEEPPDVRLPMAPRGVSQPASRLEAVRRTVGQELERLRVEVPQADMAVTQRFRLHSSFAAKLSRKGLAALARDPRVARIEKDVVWRALTSDGKALIHADYLQNLGYTGEGTSVAIVDTGVDYNHPTMGSGAIPNGKVLYGKDTADNDDDPMDCGDHGTGVASIAAGLPYTWSAARHFDGGVAPGAGILAYKASSDTECGSFYSSDVAAAIEDAILERDAYNVVALNLSLGGGFFNGPCDPRTTYGTAIDDATAAGIAVLAASGNEAKKGQITAPACVTNAISVASVYDTSIVGLSYCGDGPSCAPYLCTDSMVSAKTVTCYSNTNSYLDLFAPSELVTAAKAGGTTESFGGTSAATPYATGSVALLYDAIAGMNPVRARLLLEITGDLVTDTADDVTRPLIDLSAVLDHPGVGVGDETMVPVPDGTGTSAVSHLTLTDTGFIESARVQVKIAHPRPEQLVVTLVSPDGTRVTLHDHGPGNTPAGTFDYTVGTNGIYTVYPGEVAPEQSLDVLNGLQAAGTWRLEVFDDTAGPATGVAPRLTGWALQLTTRQAPQPPTTAAFAVPVAAHASGENGTFWVTDVRILNPSFGASANVALYLIPKGADGTSSFQQTNLEIPANTVASLPDIVSERFGSTSLQGNLVFQTDASGLLATSRTYNTGGSTGTYGQYIGMVPAASAIASGSGPLVMTQLADGPTYRTNLGFSELTGHPADVRITLHAGASGAVLGTPAVYTVPAFSNQQVNGLFAALGAPASDNAYATLEVVGGSGRVTAYASVVDNRTGDAIAIPGARAASAESFVIPIVAKKGGAAGTNWVSDLRIFNPGPATQLTLEFRPEVGTAGANATATATVGTGHQLAVNDVLGTLFGLGDASGSLRVAAQDPSSALVITSRTYNQTASGSYGQFIGAVSGGISSGGSATLISIDQSGAFRSNIGVCEVKGGTAQVRYVLKDASGSTLGVGSFTLGPYQVKQVNSVFAAVGAATQTNARVDIFLDSGDGAIAGYASVVDNLSGDAIYIPASPL